ncbi:DUF1819 family protein [Actinomyces sp. 2119]|uniref:DUF1819 family protein n=1 Tax=Actinomyces sp. 2119 TaxID=2321393 RepID=UPI0015FF25A6|nr:DUF1819 family protein [Actinomyces sp. 2119]
MRGGRLLGRPAGREVRSDLPTGPDTSCLSTSVTTPEAYRLSFVVGGLLATEATIAAPLYLELRDWAAVRQALNAGNLLHARTRSTAVRLTRELIQRLSVLTDAEIAYLDTAPGPDRLHLMWVALCRHYLLVAEFAQEVVHDHYLLGVSRLVPADFERFWDSKAMWHAELEETRPATRTKLRTNLFLALRQSGMLADDATIVSPLLSPEVLDFLDARTPSDRRFFPVGGSL